MLSEQATRVLDGTDGTAELDTYPAALHIGHSSNIDVEQQPPTAGHTATFKVPAIIKAILAQTRDSRDALDSNGTTQPKTAVLYISALQNLAVCHLQLEISCYVEYVYRSSEFCWQLDGFTPLVDLMKKYTDAIRDLDSMRQCALRGYDENPFLMKSSRALERSIFETTQLIPNHVLPQGPLRQRQIQLSRFATSALGGLLLLIPMLIMANVPFKTPSLITTCVALAGFSALVTLSTELGPHEILATTAAYAAVLVVSVGTSLANQSVIAVTKPS